MHLKKIHNREFLSEGLKFKQKVHGLEFFHFALEKIYICIQLEFSDEIKHTFKIFLYVMLYIHIYNKAWNNLYLPLHKKYYKFCLMKMYLILIRKFHINVNVVYEK